jgi:hypothetical protein
MSEKCHKSLFHVKDGIFTFSRFYSKMAENARKPLTFCDFPETAKNYFIKMNGFRGFSAQFN